MGRRTPLTEELLSYEVDVSWWVTLDAYEHGYYAKLYAALQHWIERAFPFTKARAGRAYPGGTGIAGRPDGVDAGEYQPCRRCLDGISGLLGVSEFPATPAGYARLPGWQHRFGTVCLVGIEGTGSCGAGLARHICAAGIGVVEVDRSDRQDRRRKGKSDRKPALSPAEGRLAWL